MRHADSDKLAMLVKEIVMSSSYASKFNGVDIDSDDYKDEGDFIRILIHFKSLDDLSDDDIDTITSSVEGAVAQQDDRFPSVRFSEP